MITWEYLWLRTFWREAERTDEYITRITYRHVWEPDGEEQPFVESEALNHLGDAGWELVSVNNPTESYPTRISPQQGESYSSFGVYVLVFKRPKGSV